MDAAMYIAFIGALGAIAGAIFTGVQAKAATVSRRDAVNAQAAAEVAQEKAEKAQAATLALQEDANRIASDARTALDRSAAALERANDITEAAISKPEVKWQVSPSRGDTWAVKNIGDLAANTVRLSGSAGIYTDEDSAADVVPPGQQVVFGLMTGSGMSAPVLTIEWDDETSEDRKSESIAMRY